MKRRNLRKIRQTGHHNVYVVLLDAAALKLKRVLEINPEYKAGSPCVYVGLTGLSPATRFANHKNGYKSAGIVKKYGLKLLPELYEHLNPMPYEAAAQMENDLAQDLRKAGYAVMGGH